jgi:small-conductance mechanosensitive channel
MGMAVPAPLPAQEAAPPALSDAQVDRIVAAVKAAVIQELKAEGAVAPTSPQAAAGTAQKHDVEVSLASYLVEQEHMFVQHFETALRAMPALGAEVLSLGARLDARPDGPGPLAFLGLVGVSLAIAIAAAYATALVAHQFLPGVKGAHEPGLGATARSAAVDLAGYLAFWLVTSIAAGKLFPGAGMQSLVGHWLLWAAAQFGLYYTAFRICFRPGEPMYRIVPLHDADARLVMRLFTVIGAVVILRSWISIPMADNQPPEVIAAGLLLNNLAFVLSFFFAAYPARAAVARWIESVTMDQDITRARDFIARNWLSFAGSGVIALSAIHAFGAVSGHPQVAAALTGTIRVVLAMILFCAVIEFVGRRLSQTDDTSGREVPKLPGLVSQILRVAILLGSAVYFVKLWFVDSLGVLTFAQWTTIAQYLLEPTLAVFAGWAAISYIRFLSDRYLASNPEVATTIGEDGEPVVLSDASRLRTLVPILRVTATVMIVIVLGLIVLYHLGFNITPLLAGASVIGLAISFGSQALVKDIVSGILFLAEDSFRVGEYIVCGSAKGTVEGFTLRSVRLRHQDGQIHTVPFGQLGEITNFSRDWSTVKFTMSLDRDVDLDDVRKATKKVAKSLKEDPQLADKILEPLKVQGVKDVTDTAIVVQFKFTSLPVDPSEIERAARSRLLRAFKDDGIALSRPAWIPAAAPVASSG